MVAFEIVAGGALIVAAVISLIVVFANEKATTIPLGIAVILGAGGGYLFAIGLHGVHARFHSKHVAILRDVTREGFPAKYDDVYAVGGNSLYGTEVDLRLGTCLWAFNATKVDGRWRVTLPNRDGNGVEVLTPADLANLGTVCG